ncbi:uncharacterized protein LOC132294870 [Cornus florida]|uniref:uncharacterized protein LOC132294870 n=1 Tax=Cornus florida TaxID=4283 RepID=UPI00289E4612|nr:uncharacterized protein LOC132294870 [Cornus florida]
MEETSSKRQRDETHVAEDYCYEDTKRHKSSYNQILSLLEDEEEEYYYEPNQDLSSILTTLQQELSSDSTNPDPLFFSDFQTDVPDNHHHTVGTTASDCGPATSHGVLLHEGEEGERVMRRLLEASDDELGIPPRDGGGDDEINGGDCATFSLCNGLWDIEDEAANYYSLLQSELFM